MLAIVHKVLLSVAQRTCRTPERRAYDSLNTRSIVSPVLHRSGKQSQYTLTTIGAMLRYEILRSATTTNRRIGLPLSRDKGIVIPPILRTTLLARYDKAVYHGRDLEVAWVSVIVNTEISQVDILPACWILGTVGTLLHPCLHPCLRLLARVLLWYLDLTHRFRSLALPHPRKMVLA